MKSILNIINGDSAINVMQQADIPGEYLPWRDVLHEGPVPKNLTLEKLSEIRAEYITSQGWGEVNQVKKSFKQRDLTLKSFDDYDEVVLWFEHDLYDQLQLLQILDWFSQHNTLDNRLSVICTDNYLGLLNIDQVKNLQKEKRKVTDDQLVLARYAWAAFRDDSPQNWGVLLGFDTSSLPFLDGAVLRMLQEYPSTQNGLSLTAQKALEIIYQGESSAGKVFAKYQQTEQRRFLGDSSFWNILNDLLEAKTPLLSLSKDTILETPITPEQKLSITNEGKAVLANEIDWLEIKQIDRWIGGVHLSSTNIWRWDEESRTLIKQ